MSGFVGVNWGSSNFRAYLIAPDGSLRDRWAEPAGVAALDRAGMAAQIVKLAARWPDAGPIYASGMIGSNVGWQEVAYVRCPAGVSEVAAAARETDVGGVPVTIIPGLACRRQSDGGIDILRGEETEIFGLSFAEGFQSALVGLPGTHTKWARVSEGRVLDFATSMSGELYDRLTERGLLASIVEGQAEDGEAFRRSVEQSFEHRLGLGTAMFGVRAQVIDGGMPRSEAAATLRGLVIAADIMDAMALFPGGLGGRMPLVGNAALCSLYAAALATRGVESHVVNADLAAVQGFSAIHKAMGR